MDLDTFEELTGQKIADTQRAAVSAQIARSQAMLESALGFTLDPKKVTENLYTEVGKAPSDWSWSSDNLLAPDSVVGAYRLFGYNSSDRLLHVDPFETLHAVKLVSGGVTVHTFDPVHYGAYGKVRKYISIAPQWWSEYFYWISGLRGEVELAVDADWLWEDEIPMDLQYAWAESARYHADPLRQVKSENRGTRSYTKFDIKPPFEEDATKSIIAAYAGPHGTASRMPA